MSFATIAVIAAAAAAAVAPPPPVPAPAPTAAPQAAEPVSGSTTADSALAGEVLAEIRRFGAAALKCAEVTAVRASPQPVGWQPADPNFRIGPAGSRYERWDASTCGRPDSFLVVIWTEAKGGTQFQVGHPFPAEPVKKPRP